MERYFDPDLLPAGRSVSWTPNEALGLNHKTHGLFARNETVRGWIDQQL